MGNSTRHRLSKAQIADLTNLSAYIIYLLLIIVIIIFAGRYFYHNGRLFILVPDKPRGKIS